MKNLKALAFAACALFANSLVADYYTAMSAYNPGDSLSWFYILKADTQSRAKAPSVEEGVLKVISSGKISDEAYFYACNLLKPIATDKSISVLEQYLNNPQRAALTCDVFLGLESSKIDSLLSAAAKQKDLDCAMTALSTLAARDKKSNVKAIADLANSDSPIMSKFATVALGRTLSSDAIEVLKDIVAKNDGRKEAAIAALTFQADKAFAAGEPSLAISALKSVPENYSPSIYVRSSLLKEGKREAYLDALIMKGGFLSGMAGRAMNEGRTFENSQEIIAKFPTLDKKGKLAAMGTFMLTGDTRFYPTIAPEIDSSDSDIQAEAVYTARFLCTDEANLRKILGIYKSGKRPLSNFARNVLLENPSLPMKKVLKDEAAKGDLDIVEILVHRGDLEARKQLWDAFLGGNKKAQQYLESSLTYGDLPALAANFKTVKDDGLRSEIAKIIIKKLAKSRDKTFMASAAFKILDGNLSETDPLYNFIGEKLKVKIERPKQVWQSNYKGRAVDDRDMRVASDPEPQIDSSFKPIFDGKTLAGWHTTTGNAKYWVEDGAICGDTDPAMKQNSFLITDKKDYYDFIFTCEFKWLEFGNSGVIFRGQQSEKGSVYGPQAELDNDSKRAWTGGIYNEGAQWKYSLSREDQQAARDAVKLDGWNRITIYCKGSVIKTWINGVPVSDLEWDTKPGFFGLQIHVAKKCKVLWRNIAVKEL